MRRLAVVLLAGCGGKTAPQQPAPPPICNGPFTITSPEQLAELGRCHAVLGDVTIRGAGHLDFTAVGGIESIAGTLTIGPTFDTDVIAMEGLHDVNRLRVVSNGMAVSLHMPALENADTVEVSANIALASIALGALVHVEDDLIVSQNPSLEILDLTALTDVGGILQLRNNATLKVVDARAFQHANEVDLTGSALPDDHLLRNSVEKPD